MFFVVSTKQHRKREEKRSRKERKITYTTSQRVLELYERQAAAVGLYKSHFGYEFFSFNYKRTIYSPCGYIHMPHKNLQQDLFF